MQGHLQHVNQHFFMRATLTISLVQTSGGPVGSAGSQEDVLLWLIAHTEVFFPTLLVSLTLVVEFGFRLRRASPGADTGQSAIESARDRLGVLLSLLLGFSLPMSLPHYEQRLQLVTDEANAISTVAQRAQMFPPSFRDRIFQLLPEYVNARLDFAKSDVDGPSMEAAVRHAQRLQNEMWQQTVAILPQNLSVLTPTLVQAVGALGDLIEQRQAAAERRIPTAIWMAFILISLLTCFVVGFSMKSRVLLGMLVLPLTIAIVFSLASELDNPRAGLVRESQQSLLRLQQNLEAQALPAR